MMTALAQAAHADATPTQDLLGEGPTRGPAVWGNVRLSSLLAATADRHPHRLAFADQPNREVWSGRPRIAWTYANTQHIIERLATYLADLGLPLGSPVGISLPNGSEGCVAILAVERAGYLPCLLPVGWSEDLLGEAMEAASLTAVICQSRLAEERPAELFSRLAARYFGLRFICAFGPQVPDGVIDLDRAILDTVAALPTLDEAPYPGIVSFQLRGGQVRPVFRPGTSCLAAVVTFLVAQKIDAADRIVSLIPPDDHRGLVTGLAASLVTGATLEGHGLVNGSSLEMTLRADGPVHLVAPGWMEPILAKADLPASVVSIVLVHEAPVRFKARGELKRRVTDVLGFGETALVSRTRSESGHLMLSFDQDGLPDESGSDLLRIRRDEDGTIHFGGAAAEIYDFARGVPLIPAQAPEWRSSGFKADLFAGIVIGVR